MVSNAACLLCKVEKDVHLCSCDMWECKREKKKKQEANGILNLVGLVVNISQFGQTSRI